MCPHGRITLCGMVSQYNAEVRPPGQPLLGDTEAPHDAGLPVVTFIHGGDGFSAIPDACELGVDLRLTPPLRRRSSRGPAAGRRGRS